MYVFSPFEQHNQHHGVLNDLSKTVFPNMSPTAPTKTTKEPRERLKVGTRITVYWPDDDAWYKGRVAASDLDEEEDEAAVVALIEYDDGEMAWMDLETAKWRAATISKDWLKFDNSNMQNKKKQVAKLKVGSRLSIWWPMEKQYYTGTLKEICTEDLTKSHEANSAATPHFICYDDGDEEWVNLIHGKFKTVQAKAERLQVGSRVSIRNRENSLYYRATVTKIVRERSKPHRVKYDDDCKKLGGTKEWLNLNVHHFLDIEDLRCGPPIENAQTLSKRKFDLLSNSLPGDDEEFISPQQKRRLEKEAEAKRQEAESKGEHVCIVCRCVAKRAVAAPCHHIICKRCIRFNSQEGDEALLCPLCSKDVAFHKLVKYSKDHISFRGVEALDICTAEVVHKFASASAASLELPLNLAPSQIIAACQSKRRDDRRYRGFYWRFNGSKDRILRAGEGIKDGVPIEQVDLETGEVIETFSSSRKACEKVKVCRGSIKRVLNRLGKANAGGFFWRFQGETHRPWPDPEPKNSNPVEQLDFETGDVLAEYKSLEEARVATGIQSRSCIRDVCMGKGRAAAKGFFWRWKGSKRLPVHMLRVQKVVQIRKTLKGRVIKEFRSSREAQSFFGHQCCWSTICRHCREKNYFNGFYWQYRMLRENEHPEEQLLGKRLRVKCNGEWLEGKLAGFSVDNGEHEIQFDSGALQHRRLSTLEYEWKNDKGQKPVEQLDIKTGEVVASFDSISLAAAALGPAANASGISAVATGQSYSSAGFFWRYKGSNAQPKTKRANRRKVEQLCLETGAVINTFDSIVAAGKSVGITTPGISYCCNGRNYSKSAGGFGWRFAKNTED